jgi:FlaA1/EpsC-like NDP-sugar epimerase
MTIPEAAGLVIEAACLARSGETYVLDMGEPVRILDLIDRYVAAVGAADPTIRFTGLRPGEKLHEVLLDQAERVSTTVHPRISAVAAKVPPALTLRNAFNSLYALANAGEKHDLIERMVGLLPEAARPDDLSALTELPLLELAVPA